MMAELVQYETTAEGYGIIRLNRPEKHQAVSPEMAALFLEKIRIAKSDPIKFLVITGTGDNMFCAGGDLNYLHGDLNTDEAFQALYPMKECLYDIVSFPVPTVCLLNGDALGGGCEIATACDFRIGKQGTKFGFVQTKLGIIPGWGGGVLLYEKVDPNFAFQWLLEAEVFSIEYLQQKGWIHKIIKADQWAQINDILAPFISKSKDQLAILKAQYNKKLSVLSLAAEMNEEVRHCANLWETPEHKEAVAKFFSK